jgi:hypothetical protein
MAGQGYQVPDLASVLKTLASFAPAPQGNSQHSRPQTPEPRKTREAPPSMKPESPAAVNSLKIIDPATITDWPSGLRCVMKTVAANENIIKEIRRVSCLSLVNHLFELYILTKADDKSPT